MASLEESDRDSAAEADEKPEPWETFDREVYLDVARKLVHHSFKTINSNATPGGIRLGPEAALPLPYVSARTLMAHGIDLDLDYIANAGKTAKVVKQMRAVKRGLTMANQASEAERLAITEAASLTSFGVEVGTERVDLRMRQLLVPAGESYVVLTPVTASGIGSVLFDKSAGLVTRHNDAYFAERKAAKVTKGAAAAPEQSEATTEAPTASTGSSPRLRRLGRAYLGVGGSNPQNVGALVRTLQRPLFVPGPAGQQGPRVAIAIYHRGIELPPLRELLLDLRRHREALRTGDELDTTMYARDEERRLVVRIAQHVSAAGREALATLLAHADVLPREHLLDDTDPTAGHELLSRGIRIRGMRGLIDARLREADWPESMAETVVRHIDTHTVRLGDQPEPILLLDAPARAALRRQLEDAFAEEVR